MHHIKGTHMPLLIPVSTMGKHEQANKFQYHYHDHPTLLINHKSESAWLAIQGSIGGNLELLQLHPDHL